MTVTVCRTNCGSQNSILFIELKTELPKRDRTKDHHFEMSSVQLREKIKTISSRRKYSSPFRKLHFKSS